MTDRTRLEAVCDVAVRAAREAGGFIRSQVGTLDQERVRDKGLNELVTPVDEASQEIILRHVRSLFPDDDILAEEAVPDEERRPAPPDSGRPTSGDGSPYREDGYRWIIDPVDGTTNFAHGVPPYAVSIGVEHRGHMVVGVVYDVSRDELFSAIRGDGARMNGQPIRVSSTPSLARSLLTTGFPYRSFDHVDSYFDVLRVFFRETRGVRRPGSASVDLAWVACGRFDGFFETGLSPWDAAAGALLVEEAGGRVTDYGDGLSPIHDRQLLASNTLIHDAMAEILAPMRAVRS